LALAGTNQLHFINVTDPINPRILGHTSLSNVTMHDVKVCSDHVMATYTNQNQESGLLLAQGYNEYNKLVVISAETIYGKF
jgi:hypothetical protein